MFFDFENILKRQKGRKICFYVFEDFGIFGSFRN